MLVDAGLDLGKTAVPVTGAVACVGRLGLRSGYPLLLSASNKTFLGRRPRPGDQPSAGRRTAAAHALGITLGCRVVRAHDVRGTCRVRDMLAAILEARAERWPRPEGGQ